MRGGPGKAEIRDHAGRGGKGDGGSRQLPTSDVMATNLGGTGRTSLVEQLLTGFGQRSTAAVDTIWCKSR